MRLREAARLIESGQIEEASAVLSQHLKRRPEDAHALHLLAGIARKEGRLPRAIALLSRAVECAPDVLVLRRDLAEALLTAHRPNEALLQTEDLLKRESREPTHRALHARALEALGDYAGAAGIWHALTAEHPGRAPFWQRYARVLRGLGKSDECVRACRRAIALEPTSGAAWWNLADLKTYRFSDAEIAQLETALATAELSADDRARLHFALGKARADRELHEKSFGSYAKGNAVRRLSLAHDPDVLSAYVARAKRVFRPELFERFAEFGSDSREPIFLVGMMRSGSTLVEQILASHSRVEATRELQEIASISRHLQQQASRAGDDYPRCLESLASNVLRDLAARYLDHARAHCRLGRPSFVDKMGANFAHVGLIRLLFPRARIVDVRRHPLACGFSIFTQYFPEGQNNTFRLTDIGRHYRDYVELLADFDRVLPGAVHRVFYENLVADTEAEIRRLLCYLELPFEATCLDFHRTERAVATVSAEQVRLPIYDSALERWRNYERWLGPLKAALGSVLDCYPLVPDFA